MGTVESSIFSIVVPVRNGASRIPELINALTKALIHLRGSSGFSADLVLVDDGSTDESWKTIRHFSDSAANATLRVRGVRMDKGRGQQAAILAGFAVTENRRVLTMDDDLAHPLDALPELISALDGGFDLVYATPPKRPGSLLRRLVSRLHQYHMSLITGSPLSIRVGSYRSLTSDLIDRILNEPFSFPYVSAQSLILRPTPRVCMVETGAWVSDTRGRFSPSSLIKLEFNLSRYFGPLRYLRIRRNGSGMSTGDAARSWITEVCG